MKLAFLMLIALGAPVLAQHSHHSHDAPFGKAADPQKATRTVRVDMSDNMRFTPAEVRVKRGEVVRFVTSNKGQVAHEFVLGTRAELEKHAAQMRQRPHMSHTGHVAPGKSADVGWQFTQPGDFFFACLIPGHFEAGMVGKVIVSP